MVNEENVPKGNRGELRDSADGAEAETARHSVVFEQRETCFRKKEGRHKTQQ